MAIPILCSKSSLTSKPIADFLGPKYEVIHTVTSVDEAKRGIPQYLSSKTSQTTQPPRAIILGRKYTPAEFDDIRSACGGSHAAISWVVSNEAGENKSKFVMSLSSFKNAKADAQAIKDLLSKLREDGKLGLAGEFRY
ncbi:hypothetical protein LTR37_009603 [Vermiconidia calcicola]|uniref:Uncharacterized protein n=1 Tax=Vermiconidia calcicola TaxID=1690605 RepID=A0ACC3N8S6_9PEZI|nr:hypothetical protein LTR37_009603 [Vermiconidia calcicola]